MKTLLFITLITGLFSCQKFEKYIKVSEPKVENTYGTNLIGDGKYKLDPENNIFKDNIAYLTPIGQLHKLEDTDSSAFEALRSGILALPEASEANFNTYYSPDPTDQKIIQDMLVFAIQAGAVKRDMVVSDQYWNQFLEDIKSI